VHIGSFGADLERPTTLGRLVERLLNAVPRVRFRLSSVEATEVDERLVDCMAAAPDRLAPHLHAPLQSGSDRVLRRMGRSWYTAATYRARLEAIAARLPVLGLGADVIVGFPGESERDFAATRALVESLPFTYLHVFPYSERPETAARRLGGAAPPEVQRERSLSLRALAEEKGTAYRGHRAGGHADVVVLRRVRGWYEGLTGDYLTVRLAADAGGLRRVRGALAADGNGALRVVTREAAA